MIFLYNFFYKLYIFRIIIEKCTIFYGIRFFDWNACQYHQNGDLSATLANFYRLVSVIRQCPVSCYTKINCLRRVSCENENSMCNKLIIDWIINNSVSSIVVFRNVVIKNICLNKKISINVFFIYTSRLFSIIFTDVLIVIIRPASISVAICRQRLEATSPPESARAVIQTTLIDNLKYLRMFLKIYFYPILHIHIYLEISFYISIT